MVGNNIAQEYYNTFDIIRILNPKDPIEKAKADSRYAHNLDSQEIQRIVAAIGLYRDEIIIPKYKKD